MAAEDFEENYPVLVTGGGGFLGRYVVRRLMALGHPVRILGRRDQPELRELGVEVHCGSIEDPAVVRKACEGMACVQHIAAKAGVWGSWDSYFRANVTGTLNVLGACRELGIQRLVYTSTPSVVFNRQDLRGVDETQPYGQDWLCHYAHTKMLAEQEVLAAHDPEGSGLKTVALRPHLIWGPGDNHLIPRIVDRARKGRLKIVGDGNNLVDIVHVVNAAEAQVLAMQALDARPDAGGRAFFISQGEPVRIWDWLNDLLTGLSIPRIEKKIPMQTAYKVGAVAEGIWKVLHLPGEPPMTRFVAMELAKDHYFDISAAKDLLGYEAKVTTEAGLAELIRLIGNQG